MAVTGDTLTMPDGTSFCIIESAADSGGARIEFEITMAPGAQGPPKHFHPRQDESWEVIEGELSPALDFQDYIEALDRQATAGKMTSRMSPATLIHGAMVLRLHRATQLSASPAQRMVETGLSVVGRALGYRP